VPRAAGWRAAVEQMRMGLTGEAQHAGDCHVRMPDCFAEPIGRGDRGTFLFQRVKHA